MANKLALIGLFFLPGGISLIGFTRFPNPLAVKKTLFRHATRCAGQTYSYFFLMFPEIILPSTSAEMPQMGRRRVMGGLGLAGLGMLASSASANAFTSNAAPKVNVHTQSRTAVAHQSQRIDLSELPVEWARNQGSLLPDYARYLWGLKLVSISPAQVIEAHAKSKGSVWNSLPPKAWWTRMGYTLRVADRVAREMNVRKVEIVSAYRNSTYNAHCEGARVGSWHQANVAVDVKFQARASQVTATARNLRDRGLFRGGVGGYSDFTHIDTRGENTNW